MVITAGHDYYSPMRTGTRNITINPNIKLAGYRLCQLFLWLLVASGCASLPEAPVTADSESKWASQQSRLSQLDSWEIHARAAIFAEEDVYHVGINWQRRKAWFVMVIEAPFGQGVIRLESYSGGNGLGPVVLSLPDGQQYSDASAEALLLRALGWTLPVKGLKSWIKGLPMENDDYSFELSSDGRLKSLEQDKWTIHYLSYFDFESEFSDLPQKMYLKHPDLALKIVVDRWHQDKVQDEIPQLFPEFD